MLDAGQKAPEFAATAHNGEPVRVGPDGPSVCVVYFYPKDETYGCTIQACSFRDAYENFASAGATVIGISADSDASHQAFAKNHDLPFLLVSDKDGRLRQQYDVNSMFGLLPGRVTYVIDGEGLIRHAFSSQVRAGKHVDEALAVVRKLASASS